MLHLFAQSLFELPHNSMVTSAQEFPRAHVYGAARSGVKVEAIMDSSQLLAMDVSSDESVAAAIALILRKHKVCFHLT